MRDTSSEHEIREKLISSLHERAKELNCLYRVDGILMRHDSIESKLSEIVNTLPGGWMEPDLCCVSINFCGNDYIHGSCTDCGCSLVETLSINGERAGTLTVSYPAAYRDLVKGNCFLTQEKEILFTVARRIESAVLHRRLAELFKARGDPDSLKAILDMVQAMDRNLYDKVMVRLLNYMASKGIPDAVKKMQEKPCGSVMNRQYNEQIISIAMRELEENKLSGLIHRWTGENRLEKLISVLEDGRLPHQRILEFISRYRDVPADGGNISETLVNGLSAALVGRFLTDRPEYMSFLKNTVEEEDFQKLSHSLVMPPDCRGKLGGKGVGVFSSMKLLREADLKDDRWRVRIPETWFIPTDGINSFVHMNGLTELVRYRYGSGDEIEQGYHSMKKVFMGCDLGEDLSNGLARVLKAIGEQPLAVRSSSLLEDLSGSSFRGRYRTVLLANRGSFGQRLKALENSVKQVYMSMYSPGANEYRRERNLLYSPEEMGVLIQPVVGKAMGKWFFPAFSGMAWSRNDYPWSSKIKPADGLMRLVPGLGTGASDSDDMRAVTASPGKPWISTNSSTEEIVRLCPGLMDVIDLVTGEVESLDVDKLAPETGMSYPKAELVFSTLNGNSVSAAGRFTDYSSEFTFPGFTGLLRQNSGFSRTILDILHTLKRKWERDVEIEFAFDGDVLYLLQCRPQPLVKVHSFIQPENFSGDNYLFDLPVTLHQGSIVGLHYIVYIDPPAYSSLAKSRKDGVREVIAGLNRILPGKSFALIGPGRWNNSESALTGVTVEHSDICNAAVLVEIGNRNGKIPFDVPAGTSFFQDIIESGIMYFPVRTGVGEPVLDSVFFRNATNMLETLLDDCGDFRDVVKVIGIDAETSGRGTLCIAESGSRGRAYGFISGSVPVNDGLNHPGEDQSIQPENHWLWRQKMAEALARGIDPEEMGVKGTYLFGSTKNATAGPESDIDLIIHFRGSNSARQRLESYLAGWNSSLKEFIHMKTGCRPDPALDFHIVTDADIEAEQSYALKISSVTDRARALQIGSEKNS